MRTLEEIEEIKKLHKDGHSYGVIAKMKGTSKSIVAFYCNEKRQQEVVERCQIREKSQKEYEEIVCSIIKDSCSIYQVCKKLNKRPTNNNYLMVQKIIDKYNLSTTHFCEEKYRKTCDRLSDAEVFSNRGKVYNGYLLKKRLITNGYKAYKCEKCGIDKWNGEEISLQVHHINGNRCDNRIENLQLLCPNCHSQTDSFCVKGKH